MDYCPHPPVKPFDVLKESGRITRAVRVLHEEFKILYDSMAFIEKLETLTPVAALALEAYVAESVQRLTLRDQKIEKDYQKLRQQLGEE
jgi:hypothetical protein